MSPNDSFGRLSSRKVCKRLRLPREKLFGNWENLQKEEEKEKENLKKLLSSWTSNQYISNHLFTVIEHKSNFSSDSNSSLTLISQVGFLFSLNLFTVSLFSLAL